MLVAFIWLSVGFVVSVMAHSFRRAFFPRWDERASDAAAEALRKAQAGL